MRRRHRSPAVPAAAGLAERADINVTPLIDVLLVLLILFLLVSRASRAQLAAGLPRPGPLAGTATALTVSVRENDLSLDGRPVLDAVALQAALATALQGRRDRPVWVESSPEASYERVVGVLDAVRGAGATRVGILGAKVTDSP